MSTPNFEDPFDLNRFLTAQEAVFDRALSEIQSGEKQTHWIWYIFPQIDGLGYSETTRHFAIKSHQEAEAYLQHPVLGKRLLRCAEAAEQVEGRSVSDIFGSPDDRKLQSCATLFAAVSAPGSVFDRLLSRYYQGQRDEKTLQILERLTP